MSHWKYWPRSLAKEQKCVLCPECGAKTTHQIRENTDVSDACRLVCSEDAQHWHSNWGEVTWEGRKVLEQPAKVQGEG